MNRLDVIILAAGKGERMKSKKPKVLHEIMGKPMIGYVIERAKELEPNGITVVVGFGREEIIPFIGMYDVNFTVQTEQKGTAHAVLCAEGSLRGGDILVLYGDVPLMDKSTLMDFMGFYNRKRAITFMTTSVEDPAGYGRVIMEGEYIKAIIEDADATPDQKEVKEINTGICIIPEGHIRLLKDIKNNNKKGEYYLTDICTIANERGIDVRGFHYPVASYVLGINSRKELMEANIIMRDRINLLHLKNGVTLMDRNVYIDSLVTIERDTVIYPDSYILGKSRIGENVTIGPNTIIKDSIIHSNVVIRGFSYIDGVEIKEGDVVGIFEDRGNKGVPSDISKS
ncbi:MAG TPA: NTP transferase domain-containing protein [Syntrophorhabdaceae bacterium]|nr:NTP transferase domain-containing protein [Syntrophorhabdaceae bacterium]HOL04661.1 NTP transferase domain-containing protein [Syntrophorhabdaceae bacterium]HON85165.1 NTP transferase domain-containing protein [Syntrophorhabdaceae bacterium]HOT41233.1 NTP transferase domain-containing protein [Syntrophorhabdaceae bacterium]HPC66096.1 NTP transferase domain-containing protein [Syntrophorhabdaceae bacterium]